MIPPPDQVWGARLLPGLQNSGGMRDCPHLSRDPRAWGASPRAGLRAPCRDQAALLLESPREGTGSQS